MMHVEIDETNGIAILSPDDKLSTTDFKAASATIDPYIERNGKLNGLIISVETFPGWESFRDLKSHFSFVKNHHQEVKNIAFVTNSVLGSIGEGIAKHFISAQIKTFKYNELDLAKSWILSSR
ncbi:SpoIIAA family protein [Vibrio methylphosphonaticus]|uniref:STAS/SEC14 domain-containing protein n=1 Tax=Vibrio methylphosphonaticus TaxID=2946866 RepID=UPI00202A3705|nr:STAS/SEC14 domain-containing protein [Vibrio methylphosphonaticus]MCL9775323.1 STAS/SEC14 domain-containing protein [Vibrio methylphosphonaticus]